MAQGSRQAQAILGSTGGNLGSKGGVAVAAAVLRLEVSLALVIGGEDLGRRKSFFGVGLKASQAHNLKL